LEGSKPALLCQDVVVDGIQSLLVVIPRLVHLLLFVEEQVVTVVEDVVDAAL
jgi:hypothetical protein